MHTKTFWIGIESSAKSNEINGSEIARWARIPQMSSNTIKTIWFPIYTIQSPNRISWKTKYFRQGIVKTERYHTNNHYHNAQRSMLWWWRWCWWQKAEMKTAKQQHTVYMKSRPSFFSISFVWSRIHTHTYTHTRQRSVSVSIEQ